MATDIVTGATTPGGGGDPQGTGTPPAGDPNAGGKTETDAQRIARLEGALAQSKAEKTTLEQLKAENAQLLAEREFRDGVQGPPAPAAADPSAELQARLMQGEQDIIQRAQAGDNEALYALALNRQQQAILVNQQLLEYDPETRAKVRDLMQKQGIPIPALAHQLLKGESVGTLSDENAQLKAEIERLKKTGGAARTDTPAAAAGKTTEVGVEVVTQAEYNARARKDPRGTLNAFRAGKLKLDYQP